MMDQTSDERERKARVLDAASASEAEFWFRAAGVCSKCGRDIAEGEGRALDYPNYVCLECDGKPKGAWTVKDPDGTEYEFVAELGYNHGYPRTDGRRNIQIRPGTPLPERNPLTCFFPFGVPRGEWTIRDPNGVEYEIVGEECTFHIGWVRMIIRPKRKPIGRMCNRCTGHAGYEPGKPGKVCIVLGGFTLEEDCMMGATSPMEHKWGLIYDLEDALKKMTLEE